MFCLECGGSFHEEATFQSPFFPGSYPFNRICSWLLLSEPSLSVILKFTAFNLETSQNCTNVSINFELYKCEY